MAIFVGIDTFSYPGDGIMKSLKENTDITWTGFYLGTNWKTHYPDLTRWGWGTAPIYTGKNPQSDGLTKVVVAARSKKGSVNDALYANGGRDGAEAVRQAQNASIPTQRIIYFDVERTFADMNWFHYFRGWSRAVVDANYGVGLYTRAEHAIWLQHQLMTAPGFDVIFPTIWIARYKRANPNGAPVPSSSFLKPPYPTPNPSDAGGGAAMWQHLGNFGIEWTDKKVTPNKVRRFAPVDFNVSIFKDPSLGILSIVDELVRQGA